jgi:nucleoid-associated protein YgaU
MPTPNLRMTWTRRFPLLSAAAFLAATPVLFAQDDAKPAPPPPPPAADHEPAPPPPPPRDVGDQLKALRTSLDQQTLQIEMLTREVSLLRKKLEGGQESAAPTSTEHPAPATSEAAPAPAPAGQPEVRAAEATGGGVKHVVAKGETLTSIAKQYNIPIATLQKANKIQDARKLQTGTVLSIPSTTPENPPEKKENP